MAENEFRTYLQQEQIRIQNSFKKVKEDIERIKKATLISMVTLSIAILVLLFKALFELIRKV